MGRPPYPLARPVHGWGDTCNAGNADVAISNAGLQCSSPSCLLTIRTPLEPTDERWSWKVLTACLTWWRKCVGSTSLP